MAMVLVSVMVLDVVIVFVVAVGVVVVELRIEITVSSYMFPFSTCLEFMLGIDLMSSHLPVREFLLQLILKIFKN